MLSKYSAKLGDELWSVLESVLLNAVEYRQTEWITYCIERLKNQFPKSRRVKRLLGMIREAMGDWESALNIYASILEEVPEDGATRKRVIAVHKCQGNTAKCADLLNKHLEEFVMDAEAWHELGHLYIVECQMSRALFCFEELLLHDPNKLYCVLTYAELLGSTGDVENCRKYYSFALSIDPNCLRALWGILMISDNQKPSTKGTSKRIGDDSAEQDSGSFELKKGGAESKHKNMNLHDTVLQRLTNIYQTQLQQSCQGMSSSSVALRLLKNFA